MAVNQEFAPERRRCLRQMVHAPAFASFDGVSGGMILDLSEEGLSMQMGHALDGQSPDGKSIDKGRPVRLDLDLSPSGHVETTGYIAWADALGRAGVRFSDLPEAARRRLNEWLTVNAGAPSHIAPKVAFDRGWGWGAGAKPGSRDREHMTISLEADTEALDASEENGSEGQDQRQHERQNSATVQYEFSSLGTDLAATLRLIGERARVLTRGTSAAIALVHKDAVICRASVGESAPALGARLDVNSGLSGECFREGKSLRCDDAENDPRVDLESCRRLGVRSILAAPVRYERDTVGLLMVFSSAPFNFDEGDVAVVESLAHTVIRSMRQAEMR
jgi:putative methionine-R-sulfoxide reductase with GAF domain